MKKWGEDLKWFERNDCLVDLLLKNVNARSLFSHLVFIVVVTVEGTHEPVIFEEGHTLTLMVDIP